jgi:methionyl aminopeptidase
MDVIRPGALVREIGAAIDGCVTACGFSVVRELGGHGLGRRIHEWPSVPNYCDRRQRDRLHDGLVIAVEPIISAGRSAALVGSDGWTIRTQDGSLAAHFEHTVAVTAAGPVLLTRPDAFSNSA